jgi:alanine racemase
VLSIIDQDPALVLDKNIALVVYDMATAEKLNAIGQRHATKISVHAKVDTGLSRAGILYTQAIDFIKSLATMNYLRLDGIFSHFANVEHSDQTFSTMQRARFNELLKSISQNNIIIAYQHISCSAALTATHENYYTFARSGIGIYGLWPSVENKKITEKYYPHFTLKPVLVWKTRIIQLKTVPAESYVGYDLTYQTHRPTTIALLPVGYWDGYDRGLSNKGTVIINGQKAPVVGRIAMNLTMIDCTDIANVHVGDEVMLLGPYEGITADDIAQTIQTINYEVVTRINPLLPRIIVP